MDTFALVVGESLVDVVVPVAGTTVERPGGSAANVAVALARLGRDVRFATAFADDEHGRMLAEHLAGSGVALARDPHVLERTSTAVATLGAGGAATYAFDLDWRLGRPPAAAPDDGPAFVHACSLGAVLAPGADDVLALLDTHAGAFVTYDVNVRAAVTGTGPDLLARVEAVARRADLVKASDEDLASLYPLIGVAEAADHLRALGPSVVVVTRGADGATWYDGGTPLTVAAAPTTVVDTIGAGDTFAAALVDALWSGLDPEQCLTHAAAAAAVTVSRAGADPPRRDEL